MKKTWDVSRVEIVHSRITTEEFDQVLDDWAEIVYRHFCQLHETDSKVSDINAANALERSVKLG